MGDGTGITWTDATWNPVRGCSRVSAGCENCYAERQAHRFAGTGGPYDGLTTLRNGRPGWTGEVRFVPEMLDQPLRWRKPRMVFVNSMSDLFHERLTDEQIAAVFGVMAACPQHVFQVLTKRPQRMLEWFEWIRHNAGEGIPFGGGSFAKKHGITSHRLGETAESRPAWNARSFAEPLVGYRLDIRSDKADQLSGAVPWPLPNAWLGVSIENQATADERIPLLLQTPAAIRWVSAEPLLGPVNLRAWAGDPCDCMVPALDGAGQHAPDCKTFKQPWGLDWVVVGGESGPDARPCNVEWIRNIVRQCGASGVPAFVKQMGSRSDLLLQTSGKGSNPSEWPDDLRVREWPS